MAGYKDFFQDLSSFIEKCVLMKINTHFCWRRKGKIKPLVQRVVNKKDLKRKNLLC